MLAALTLTCVLDTGCSNGASHGNTAPSGDGGPGAKVTCDQLMNGDVQGLMTNMVTGRDVMPVGTDAAGQQCIFHDEGSEQAVDIIVVPASDPVIGYDVGKRTSPNPVALPGIGDDAFRATGDLDPVAEHGGVMCTVSIAAAVQVPGVSALVVNGSLNLTEGQDTIIAEALGTVCNRIFRSGNTKPDLSGL